MSKIQIKIKTFLHSEDLPLPSYATIHSAGMDLLAAIDVPKTLKPMERYLCPTGIAIALPEGFEAQIRSRSGLAYKSGIVVVNSPGTIDPDYRGEVFAALINLSQEEFIIHRGMRIAQMIVGGFSQVNWNLVSALDETIRGSGCFGSTGIK